MLTWPAENVRSAAQIQALLIILYSMKQFIAHVTIVVNDYDEAIRFYTEKLGFELVEDTALSATKRWVLVAPPGSTECRLLLAKAADSTQAACVGRQTGGRVFLFLYTDDFRRDYHTLQQRGVTFVRQPSEEDYGTVAVFQDLYGNLWDLLQPKPKQ
jgi:catechol 2,3-dioxygenase-like lactoylglutathione lyase family enzyme